MTELKLNQKERPLPAPPPAVRLPERPVAEPTGWSPSAWRSNAPKQG